MRVSEVCPLLLTVNLQYFTLTQNQNFMFRFVRCLINGTSFVFILWLQSILWHFQYFSSTNFSKRWKMPLECYLYLSALIVWTEKKHFKFFSEPSHKKIETVHKHFDVVSVICTYVIFTQHIVNTSIIWQINKSLVISIDEPQITSK